MKKSLQLITAASIISLFFLSSCQMDKKMYSSGYHIEWYGKHQKANKTEYVSAEKTKTNEAKSISAENNTNEALTASSDNSTIEIVTPKTPPVFNNKIANPDCGDMIIEVNGDEIKAKVLSVGDDDITYKKCDNVDGPSYSVKKSEVFMIQYANGTKDVITPNNSSSATNNANTNVVNVNVNNNTNSAKIIPGSAKAALVLGILGLISGICSILAIIFGAAALIKIGNHPDIYTGRARAIAGLVLGIVFLAILAIVIGSVLFI